MKAIPILFESNISQLIKQRYIKKRIYIYIYLYTKYYILTKFQKDSGNLIVGLLIVILSRFKLHRK